MHVTPALVLAIHDYRTVESTFSDHGGIVAVFDLNAIDRARVVTYT